MVTFLITSGPTKEYIDPVRFISNASSGKMGFELASYAKKSGNNVILVSGSRNAGEIRGVKTIPVVSALEMQRKVRENIPKADIFISAAAVSDYRPLRIEKNKIKKTKDILVLKLVKNPDILKEVSLKNKNKVMVGFCLESKDLIKNALKKLKDKNLDLIVANMPDAISKDTATAFLIDAQGREIQLKNKPKKDIAKRIIDESLGIFKNRKAC
jgi:phosphopantothenoylcysteine synthetase/decarboxylase